MNTDPGAEPFKDGTGFLLSKLGSFAERSWASLLKEHGVTQTEFAVLVTLDRRPDLSQKDLALAVAVDPRNIVAIVAGLLRRGLVAQEVHPDDARRRVVNLTRSGRMLVRALVSGAAGTRNDFIGALSTEEALQLNQLLLRVYAWHLSVAGLDDSPDGVDE